MENAPDLPRRPPDQITHGLPDGARPLATLREVGRALAGTPHFKRAVARAAKLLDTTGRLLGYKAKKYGVDCGRFR